PGGCQAAAGAAWAGPSGCAAAPWPGGPCRRDAGSSGSSRPAANSSASAARAPAPTAPARPSSKEAAASTAAGVPLGGRRAPEGCIGGESGSLARAPSSRRPSGGAGGGGGRARAAAPWDGGRGATLGADPMLAAPRINTECRD
ncbi:unnamed protein product, partial [Prorocentrum cordatum]